MEENKPPLEGIKTPSYAEAKARMEHIVASAVIDFVQQWGGGILVSIEATASEVIKTEAGGKSIMRKTRLNEMTVKRWEDA
jgi:hypothetical protein